MAKQSACFTVIIEKPGLLPYNIETSAAYIEESKLIAGLRAKQKTALEYLYDHYSGALYGTVFRIVRKEEIAEEVLQDVFLKIWDRIESYDPAKGRLFTWMLNLAKNQAIDKTRSKEINRESKTGPLENFVSSINKRVFRAKDRRYWSTRSSGCTTGRPEIYYKAIIF